MKVLLLGGNGFLGQNVLRRLLDEGHSVVLIVRHNAHDFKELANTDGTDKLSVIQGTFLDAATLSQAAQGCEAVVNCTGTTDMGLLRLEDYLPVNRDGCQRVVETMEYHGIRTLVHVSTANTIGYGTPEKAATETDAMESPFKESFYAQSKLAGEEIVLPAARQHPDWHVVVVNPGFMLGPYDFKPSSGQLLLAGYRKPLMAVPQGGKSFIHVGDAAAAIVNALTLGRHGERYLLTGQNMSLKEFYQLESMVCGYRQRIVTLPNGLVRLAGRIGDLLRLCGWRTQLSTRNVRQLLVREYYDNHHACSELQMPKTPIEDAIKAFFDQRAR